MQTNERQDQPLVVDVRFGLRAAAASPGHGFLYIVVSAACHEVSRKPIAAC